VSCRAEEPCFNDIGFLRIGFNEYQTIGPEEMSVITKLNLQELAALQAKHIPEPMATWYDETEFSAHLAHAALKKRLADNYGLKSHLHIPLDVDKDVHFMLDFYSRRADAYDADNMVTSERLKPLFVNLVKTMLTDETNPYRLKVQAPVSNNDSKRDITFNGIVGRSHLLLNVFDQILQVAPHNSSVLILGESGTGKEKIAERLHYLSSRKGKPFVKVNCGALPTTLIDSELFGHEKGAFTGAYERKIGRFEQANTGTIFLDEIGDLPLDSQVKLLRVLQEREFERLGGRGTIKTDVRIIAATNRDLEKEVAEGRFRLDLFYRLNVIQIIMPALRERTEDIPLLADHFLHIYNSKAGKSIKRFSDHAIESMLKYGWPGNIRELENLVERNVLLCRAEVIDDVNLPVKAPVDSIGDSVPTGILPMVENERAHILAALKKCNGKIWGTGGAAELLNLPPTTLNSKMKKLGINKDFLQ
jgi:transcriptional regulator with GAF, ATPase, and Fis domain